MAKFILPIIILLVCCNNTEIRESKKDVNKFNRQSEMDIKFDTIIRFSKLLSKNYTTFDNNKFSNIFLTVKKIVNDGDLEKKQINRITKIGNSIKQNTTSISDNQFSILIYDSCLLSYPRDEGFLQILNYNDSFLVFWNLYRAKDRISSYQNLLGFYIRNKFTGDTYFINRHHFVDYGVLVSDYKKIRSIFLLASETIYDSKLVLYNSTIVYKEIRDLSSDSLSYGIYILNPKLAKMERKLIVDCIDEKTSMKNIEELFKYKGYLISKHQAPKYKYFSIEEI
jgi:hypothetical protein